MQCAVQLTVGCRLPPNSPSLRLSSPQAGFPGARMVDQGCMSIQMFQLDSDCGAAFASPPTCSQACYPVAASVRAVLLGAASGVLRSASLCGERHRGAPHPAVLARLTPPWCAHCSHICFPACLPAALQIGEACRWELLSWEQSFNARQAAWGGQQYWIWQPLFAACGLAGGSSGTPGGSGGTPGVVEPAPGGGGTNTSAAGNDTFCDKASQAAEQVGGGQQERVHRGGLCWVGAGCRARLSWFQSMLRSHPAPLLRLLPPPPAWLHRRLQKRQRLPGSQRDSNGRRLCRRICRHAHLL